MGMPKTRGCPKRCDTGIHSILYWSTSSTCLTLNPPMCPKRCICSFVLFCFFFWDSSITKWKNIYYLGLFIQNLLVLNDGTNQLLELASIYYALVLAPLILIFLGLIHVEQWVYSSRIFQSSVLSCYLQTNQDRPVSYSYSLAESNLIQLILTTFNAVSSYQK